ncbi:type IV secretion system protein [Lonepinella sp. BR2882]|uniref:type IV secretion system protein n=1 Tax=Lonepinella sp. BR2882 TaxID=3095283 RepID=UPI003F6DD2E0
MKRTLKTTIKPLFAATVLAFSANSAMASGIPTADAASIATTIAENLKTLEQLKAQLDAAQQQIQQYKQFAEDTKNRFEGNMSLSQILSNDSFLNSIPNTATDFISLTGQNISTLRRSYGLVSDDHEVQNQFDKLIAYTERSKQYVKKTEDRIRNLTQLETLADSAVTPAQKADIANKLAIEKLKYDQEQLILEQKEKQFEAQKEAEKTAKRQQFLKTMEANRKK